MDGWPWAARRAPFVEGGLNPIWSPDGKNVAYHTNDPGDPIFIADRNGSNPRRIFVRSRACMATI